MEGLSAFILAGFAMVTSPGPATLSIAASSAAFGPRRSFGYMAGAAVGLCLVMGIVASGLTGALLALPGATPVVTVAAALYMAYLAYRIATAPPLAEGAGQGRPPSFAGGLFLSLVNPKAYAVMAALFSGFVLTGDPGLDALLKASVMTVITFIADSVWLFAGAALTRCFRQPRVNRAINIGFAALLLASVGFAMLS